MLGIKLVRCHLACAMLERSASVCSKNVRNSTVMLDTTEVNVKCNCLAAVPNQIS